MLTPSGGETRIIIRGFLDWMGSRVKWCIVRVVFCVNTVMAELSFALKMVKIMEELFRVVMYGLQTNAVNR